MVGYNFQPQFAKPVRLGEKRLTLRRARHHPARHAEIGEVLSLWTGQRTKEAALLARGLCAVRASLTLAAAGVVGVHDFRVHEPLRGDEQALEAALFAETADDFARLDGFENWAAAWVWHSARAGASERPSSFSGPLQRELVAWRLLVDQEAVYAATRAEILPEVA